MVTVADLILPKKGIAIPEVPSYIKFDGAFGLGEGTLLGDKSRYRSHGTISGADWATGAHGKCLDFDPTKPSYVEIPAAHTQLDFTSEDFSGIARIYIDDLTSHRQLFSRGRIDKDGWWWRLYSDKRHIVYLNRLGSHTGIRSVVGAISSGAWYTLGFSRNGTAGKVFVNGVDKTGVVNTLVNPVSSARTAKIGIHDNLTDFPFDGKIEFLRIFGGVALSASEHLAYHNALK